jgi:hypothetical protein
MGDQRETRADPPALRTSLSIDFESDRLSLRSQGTYQISPTLNRIVILGLDVQPSKCLFGQDPVAFSYDESIQALTVHDLQVSLNTDNQLEFVLETVFQRYSRRHACQ